VYGQEPEITKDGAPAVDVAVAVGEGVVKTQVGHDTFMTPAGDALTTIGGEAEAPVIDPTPGVAQVIVEFMSCPAKP
jgi:hypothetical protein